MWFVRAGALRRCTVSAFFLACGCGCGCGGGGGGRFIDAGFRLVVVGVAVWWGGGWWGAVLKGKVLTCVVRSGRGVASMQGFDLVVVGGAVCSAGERV